MKEPKFLAIQEEETNIKMSFTDVYAENVCHIEHNINAKFIKKNI
jgi:hypothetical protein